ncbi:MAG: hypothetical protein IJ323_06375 [Clostridia bacterium]|nr:hypothetical protein [Clostridia bacterium]
MAKHEFGIMERAPAGGERYDEYEPEKYSCIFVDDDYIEDIQEKLCVFDTFSHTVDIPMKGLNYCGITLIPPMSISTFLSVLGDGTEYENLRKLLIDAEKRNKFVIHYGL